jgi:hypothetical protein
MKNAIMSLIDPQVFVELDKDENTVSAKYNKYDVLEDICRYWGLTARVYRRSVYLTYVDNSQNMNSNFFTRLDMTQLASMASGTSAGTSVSIDNIGAIGNVFASIDNDVTLQRGYSKATVKGDAGNADKEVIKCFPDYVVNNDMQPPSGSGNWDYGDEKYIIFSRTSQSLNGIDLTGTADSTKATFGVGTWQERGGYSTDAQVLNLLACYAQYDANTVLVRISTVYEHNYGGTFLTFNADTIIPSYKLDFTSGDHDYGDHTIYVRIGIARTRGGSTTYKYYNGSSWGSSSTTCQLTIGNKGKTLYIVNGTSRDDKIDIPNAAGYYGRLFIEILGTNEETYDRGSYRYSFALVDFTINVGYMALSGLTEADYQNSYKEMTEVSGNSSLEVWNANCIFCSYGGVKYGYGIISNADGSMSAITSQERNLAARVCGPTNGYWKTSKLMYRTELLANDSDVTSLSPGQYATIDGTPCYIIGIGRDWRDDVAKILFIER